MKVNNNDTNKTGWNTWPDIAEWRMQNANWLDQNNLYWTGINYL